jgi:hypothetical protein
MDAPGSVRSRIMLAIVGELNGELVTGQTKPSEKDEATVSGKDGAMLSILSKLPKWLSVIDMTSPSDGKLSNSAVAWDAKHRS